MSEPRDVTVSIFGNRYTLRSEGEAEQLEQLAAEVDARMREAAGAGGAMGADRVAVLVALNLADELLRERGARHEDRETVRERTGRIIAILDDGLN